MMQQSSTQDSELWHLLTDVPRLAPVYALGCTILNLLIAGTGTMLSGILADTENFNKTQICIGFLMFLTQIYVIGYVFSLYWAYLILEKAFRDRRAVRDYLKQTEARA